MKRKELKGQRIKATWKNIMDIRYTHYNIYVYMGKYIIIQRKRL